MSTKPGDEAAEIVIVRRRLADDGAATKAGAWKIAYADFVTAMMAFFLVMWLINASNEETRSQVASYFNPIKLTDSSTGARSLKDMKDTRNPQNRQTGETAEGSPPSKKDMMEEAAMLANPPKSIDRIAKAVSESDYRNAGLESNVEITPSLKPDKSNPGVGDPYDPKSWEKAATSAPLQPDVGRTDVKASSKQSSELQDKRPALQDMEAKAASPQQNKSPSQEATEISREIAANLGHVDPQLSRAVEVTATSDGLLVSLTDGASFEMFKTGSAEPEPQMLKLVAAVAEALKPRRGKIIIRGHTDSRPYRNKYYDNWQLSTARAHLARYMLTRGGLDEARIRRVEGVADREPKIPQDPQAAENRRIEILITSDDP